MKKAFTLMEILIVLIIIGILTGILIPSFKKFRENAELIKFLRAHQAFTTAISSLANSDYYMDGDFGTKPDGTYVNNSTETTLFCETLSQFVDTKSVKCPTTGTGGGGAWSICWGQPYQSGTEFHQLIDETCNGRQGDEYPNIKPGEGIVLKDGTVIYESNVTYTYGMTTTNFPTGRHFDDEDMANCKDDSVGIKKIYKIFCIDIDGVPTNDKGYWVCGNQCPFGYGVRIDGKILPGKRATEWLNKANKQNVVIQN